MVEVENKIQPYERYKDSGVEWLGEIPEHWEVLPLFALTKLKSITNNNDLELLSVYLDKGVIRFSDVTAKRTNVTSLDLSKYQLVEPGDFVLNNQQAWRGSVGVSTYKGIVSPAYIVLSLSEKIDPYFANYLFRDGSMVSQYLINSKGVGTIQRNLYWPSLRRSSISLPPFSEQTAIANFLDDKTEKIDQAMSIKEQQIALLKERKQTLIHKAVTRGLDDSVPLKDSGVEWIGEIPEHWEVKPIKYLGKIVNGYAFNSGEFRDKGVRVMKISNIQTMRIDWTDESFIDEKYYESLSQFRISENDLVFALTRPIISTGIKASIVDTKERILLNQRNAVLKPSKELYKKWIYYVILDSLFTQAFDKEIDKTGQQPNISTTSIGNIKTPYPSLSEQKEISAYIELASQKIETAISLKQQEIDKLKEYKRSLINSVVTGKVKVS